MNRTQIHVRLESDEAVNSKRNLLSAEINFINIIKKLQDYKKTRVIELRKKARMRTELRKLHAKIKEMEKILPELERKKKSIEKQPKVIIEKSKKNRLENELQDIREKLTKLN